MKLVSGETDMNRFSSHRNHENLTLYEGLPPQGLSEARQAGSFFKNLSPIHRTGSPVGGSGIHRIRWIEG
jgi:hypothetical protein